MKTDELPIVIQVIEDRLKELRNDVEKITNKDDDDVDLQILANVSGRYLELVNIKSILIRKGILNTGEKNE